jgi:Zn finger protein HypA/HybF involved in hydrogenase expression
MSRHPGRLIKVGVQCGTDSGVEPASLSFCLEAVLAHSPFNGARAVLEPVPGEVLRLDFVEIDDGGPDDRSA